MLPAHASSSDVAAAVCCCLLLFVGPAFPAAACCALNFRVVHPACSVTLYPSFGKLLFFELPLHNPYSHEERFKVQVAPTPMPCHAMPCHDMT